MHNTRSHASLAALGLLGCAAIALAQAPTQPPTQPPAQPPAHTPPAQTPPARTPPTRSPSTPAKPSDIAGSGYMATPKYAQSLDTTLSENTIQICVDNDFKGEQNTVKDVLKMHQPGTMNELPANFDDSITSLRWNIEPGVLVVLFEDPTGKGQQLALWGKGQIPDLGKVDFNETASRWAWYNVGGGAQTRSTGDVQLPHGAQPSDGSEPVGSMVFFDDQNYLEDPDRVNGLSGIKAGEWREFTNGKENAASSMRWNLPEGVIVILAAEDGGNDNIILFGEGQNPDLAACDFNNRASRWSWAYIGAPSMKDAKPNMPRE